MLAEVKLKTLLTLISQSTKEELIWMSGYLSGHISQGTSLPEAAPEVAAAKPVAGRVTIAYGTETGNSKRVATEFASKAKKTGLNTRVVSLDQYRLNDLEKEEYFLAVVSTQGEGEPPAAAQKFYDHIHQTETKLSKLKYSVLALGDTSYPLFCKAGEDVDTQLQRLGGNRITPIQKCDVDFEDEANVWLQSVLQALTTSAPAAASAQVNGAPAVAKKAGKKTYTGTVLTNLLLNDTGSRKKTHHIEIAAEELEYEPGDALGVVPVNWPATVAAILKITELPAGEEISFRNHAYRAQELLSSKLNVTYLPERVVKQYAHVVGQNIPATRIDLLDLLKIYPVKDTVQFKEVLQILEPITPRLYSISSSLEAFDGEIHLTVARDEFRVNEEELCGHCSDYLSELPVDAQFEFYIHKNHQFKLPAPEKDIIMVGPGTGVAPFRAFLAHRDATGAEGRNWLFFGDQHFATDFLYQTEIQSWAETGVLTHVNVAFSRDQKEKVYVQHKMLQNAAAVYEWISSGAYFYVCGAKEPMSVDVENTLLQIIAEQGGLSAQDAQSFLDKLKEEGRYLKDVY
jgi:sulfite reductase (NADPH) flavoprotein alpha-component